MRIGDWSSDVCSSDLPLGDCPMPRPFDHRQRRARVRGIAPRDRQLDIGIALAPDQRAVRGQLRNVQRPIMREAQPLRRTIEFEARAALVLVLPLFGLFAREIGRGSWRERVWQYV